MEREMSFLFEFSVIMAVYNVEPFLKEAVDSLIAQDFGFEKIQLIMVDDGSTDGSGAICDAYAAQYPGNVMVIHKENGGVSSARNEGLRYATGRYLNFMDSDDRFTEDAFQKVYDFFKNHEKETDVVTIPLEFFDAQRGAHWQNEKFGRGTRVLDLYWDYQATIMFVNASFFRHEVKADIVFDGHLVCGEDMKVLLTVLIKKMKLGVVSDCKYMYRRRSVGEASLIQSAKKKRSWYFDYFTYLVDWAVKFYGDTLGYLPAFVQYELLCDLQWRFREIYDMSEVLTPEEISAYKLRLATSLQYFDDKYIMEQKMIWGEHKCYMLSMKHQCAPTLTERDSDVIVHFKNTKLQSVADQYTNIEFIVIQDGMLTIEGYTKIFGVTRNEDLKVFLQCNDELLPCEVIDREEINEYRFGDLIFRGIEFRGNIPLSKNIEEFCIQVVVRYKKADICKRNIRFGKFSPIGTKYKSSYYYKNSRMVTTLNGKIFVRQCGRRGIVAQECKFLKELWFSGEKGSRKAVVARIAYRVSKLIRHKAVWLFSDRVDKAGDNGEALFRYVLEQTDCPADCVFSISRHSADAERIKKLGKTVEPMSWKEKFLFLRAETIISSHFDEHIIRPFLAFSEPYRDISQNQKFIFLQHGITKDDISKWVNRYARNISIFVTSTIQEYQDVLNRDYGYTAKQVKLTGLPRFDRLENHTQKIITIMPTWRAYLVGGMNPATGKRSEKPEYLKSEYYEMYGQLLSSKELFDTAESLGYSIQFINHPNMVYTTQFADVDARLVYLNHDIAYSDIFSQSAIIVTDYSSVAFDFAYLRKPVVYFQKDYKEFFSGAHTYKKGYFNYETDGFGEVEYTTEALINCIIEYMKNGCQLKNKYRERIDHTFPYSDKNNCQRVYNEILELMSQENNR